MNESLLAALLGATAALVAALVGAASALWMEIRRDRHAERVAEEGQRAQRVANFLGATNESVISIKLLGQKDSASKEKFRTGRYYTSVESRELAALNAIQLLEPVELARRCISLHEALAELETQALACEWSRDEWDRLRGVVEPRVDAVFHVTQSLLGRPILDRAAFASEARQEITQLLDCVPIGDS